MGITTYRVQADHQTTRVEDWTAAPATLDEDGGLEAGHRKTRATSWQVLLRLANFPMGLDLQPLYLFRPLVGGGTLLGRYERVRTRESPDDFVLNWIPAINRDDRVVADLIRHPIGVASKSSSSVGDCVFRDAVQWPKVRSVASLLKYVEAVTGNDVIAFENVPGPWPRQPRGR